MISLDYEAQHPNKIICGCDEVGRGPLAGPVVAGAVIIPQNAMSEMIAGINDSKKLSAIKREYLAAVITTKYVYAIGEASVDEIELYNILNATKLAITRAVENLAIKADIVLVDGNMKFDDDRFVSIIKGDQKSYTIACASIVAKCYRDNLMKKLAMEFPFYAWEQNAGYGTKFHIDAIKEHGPTIHHRKRFIQKL